MFASSFLLRGPQDSRASPLSLSKLPIASRDIQDIQENIVQAKPELKLSRPWTRKCIEHSSEGRKVVSGRCQCDPKVKLFVYTTDAFARSRYVWATGSGVINVLADSHEGQISLMKTLFGEDSGRTVLDTKWDYLRRNCDIKDIDGEKVECDECGSVISCRMSAKEGDNRLDLRSWLSHTLRCPKLQ